MMNRIHLLADWRDVVFIHFTAEPEQLQRAIPYPLDRRDGTAFVSLVAFTLSNMRANICPAMTRELLRPWSEHQFLNVRTYVQHKGDSGIYFLAEYLNRAAAVPLGGIAYGLPYHLGNLDYDHADPHALRGEARRGTLLLRYVSSEQPSAPGWIPKDFLLDRFHAFTEWRGWRRKFEVVHGPWQASEVRLDLEARSLLDAVGAWAPSAQYAGAHFSRGVRNVVMSPPTNLGRN